MNSGCVAVVFTHTAIAGVAGAVFDLPVLDVAAILAVMASGCESTLCSRGDKAAQIHVRVAKCKAVGHATERLQLGLGTDLARNPHELSTNRFLDAVLFFGRKHGREKFDHSARNIGCMPLI